MSISNKKFGIPKNTHTDLVFGFSVEIVLVLCQFQNSEKFLKEIVTAAVATIFSCETTNNGTENAILNLAVR